MHFINQFLFHKGKESHMTNETSAKPLIVIVDDNPHFVASLKGLLEDEDHPTVLAYLNPESAIKGLTTITCPFILLIDYEMPQMSGTELIRYFKGASKHPFVTCLISMHRNARLRIEARRAGAHDYFQKGEDDQLFLEQLRVLEESLRNLILATVDSLTQAAKKDHAEDLVRDCLASKPNDQGVALLFLDVDRFKRVNDVYGHAIGDEVLRAVGLEVIHHIKRASDGNGGDIFWRKGGDEFCVVLRDVSEDDARTAANRIREGIQNRPVRITKDGAPTEEIFVDVSIGVGTLKGYSGPLGDAQAMLTHLLVAADADMYRRKKGKRLWTKLSGLLARGRYLMAQIKM